MPSKYPFTSFVLPFHLSFLDNVEDTLTSRLSNLTVCATYTIDLVIRTASVSLLK